MITIFSEENLTQYRQKGDSVLEELLDSIDHNTLKEIWSLNNDSELFNKDLNSSIKTFVNKLCNLPDWFDEERIHHSDDFFLEQMQDLLMMLGLVSLPYCYGGADGSKVLVSSGRILSNTTNRLKETGTFVWDVCNPNAFSGKGKGFLSCLKVRLIHQFTRSKLLKEGWDSDTYGFPVNQLDQAGTNLSFSLIAIRAIRKMGKNITDDQMDAYIHRWNVISYLLGLDESLAMNSIRSASILSRAIEKIQFRKSEEGVDLTSALLKSIYEQAGFSESYKRLLPSYMGYLIGMPTAKYLNLNPDSGFKNVFEFNTILTRMRSVFPWVPVFGMENSGSQGMEEFESVLAEIPMLK